MQLPDPNYHGTLETWLLLVRLSFTILARTWLWVPIVFLVGSEFYLRHEKEFQRSWSTLRVFGARALRVPTLTLSPKLVRVEKSKARKAVA